MKILVVCQYYYPEQVRITDICEEFVKRGHEVDVITDIPNYPMGVIFDGYKHGERRDEVINGVNVHRCFTIARRSGVLFRFLNYYSYAFSSTRYASKLKKEYDAVLVNQLSPVMMACAAVKYKKKHNKRLVYYCLDLWPESLVAGGIKRGGFIYKFFNKISENLYKKADKILVTSRDFTTYLENQFGIEKDKLSYLPQYAEDLFKPAERVKKDTVDLTFAGNIGVMQSVETIIRAAAELKEIENLRFNIVGDGISLEDCKKLSDELGTDNVIFHGRKPLEEMSEYYRNADAMLVTLAKDPLISMTIPGKVQTYMAAGKPVIGAIDGETPKVIEEAGCGYCSPSGDYMALAENIREFLVSDIDELGRNSAKYYEENFRKDKYIDTLLAELGETENATARGKDIVKRGFYMKICMVVPLPPPYGGIANWSKLIDEYSKNIDDVDLSFVNTAAKKRSMEGRTLWDRVVVQGLEMFRVNKQMKKLLKSENHDAVHMTTSGQLATFRDILMLKTAKKMGVPTVYHIRFGRVPEIAKNNTGEWKRLKKAMLLADRVIAIDTSTLEAVKKYASDVKVCYVPNPFDMSKIKDIEVSQTPKKEVVFVGWVIKTKGVEELVEAWQALAEKFPDWTLKIVGPYDTEYKNGLERKYKCENVVFLGEKPHDEAMKIVASSSVFTLPSYTEGFPNAVLEAMALEKPIVATSVGAIPDMLCGCGVVVPPENSRELENALSDLISNEELRNDFAKKAKHKMLGEYTIDKIFESYKTIWNEIR